MKRIALLFFVGLGMVAQADVVNPIGEENLGHILVRLPKTSESFYPVRVLYRNAPIPLEKKSQRFPAGEGCLVVEGLQESGAPYALGAAGSLCKVKILPGKTTEIVLSYLKATYEHPELLKSKNRVFGYLPGPKQPYGALGFFYQSVNGEIAGQNLDHGFEANAKMYRVVVPGTLEVSLPFPTGAPRKKFTVAAGATVNAKLSWGVPDMPTPGRLKITAPERLLPNDTNSTQFKLSHCTDATCRYLWDKQGAKAATYLLPQQEVTLDVYPVNSGAAYRLLAANANTTAEMVKNFDMTEGGETTLQLSRIDVNHPKITKENGEVYEVKGTYTVARRNNAGVMTPVLNYRLATGTGVDLLPGEYNVNVVFSTSEGQQTKDYPVVLKDEESKADDESVSHVLLNP